MGDSSEEFCADQRWQLAESGWHLKLERIQLGSVLQCVAWCFKNGKFMTFNEAHNLGFYSNFYFIHG